MEARRGAHRAAIDNERVLVGKSGWLWQWLIMVDNGRDDGWECLRMVDNGSLSMGDTMLIMVDDDYGDNDW